MVTKKGLSVEFYVLAYLKVTTMDMQYNCAIYFLDKIHTLAVMSFCEMSLLMNQCTAFKIWSKKLMKDFLTKLVDKKYFESFRPFFTVGHFITQSFFCPV